MMLSLTACPESRLPASVVPAAVNHNDGSPHEVWSLRQTIDVPVSGERPGAVSTAMEDDVMVAEARRLWVYTRAQGRWSRQQELVADDDARLMWPEVSDGQVLAAGTHHSVPDAVYVFGQTNGAWTQKQRLVPSDGAAIMYFQIHGGTLVVLGQTNPNALLGESDAAYVFERRGDTWSERQVLSIEGSVIFHGTLKRDVLVVFSAVTPNQGVDAAHVFVRTNGVWVHETRFATDGPLAIGHDVAIFAPNPLLGTLTVAARRAKGTWEEVQVLVPRDQNPTFAGGPVLLDGETAVVRAFGNDSRAGVLYVFERKDGVWHERQRLGDPDALIRFGNKFALDANTLIANSTGDYVVFVREQGVWREAQTLPVGEGTSREDFGLYGDTLLLVRGAEISVYDRTSD